MKDNPRARFRDFVVLNIEAHKILPEAEERSLIGEGISKFKLDGGLARGVVAVVAGEADQILASEVSRNMLKVLHQIGGKRGAVDKRGFEQGVTVLKALVKGHITDDAARAWLKRLIEGSELKVRGSGLFRRKRWFRKIKAVP